MKCKFCGKPFSSPNIENIRDDEYIRCERCQSLVHPRCIGTQHTDYKVCPDCVDEMFIKEANAK